MRWQLLVGGLLIGIVSGCGARVVKFNERGVTCTEAQNLAITAVQKMGYTIGETRKPLPGLPGMIRAARTVGTEKKGMFVQVFCTRLGAEVEAQTDKGGALELSFGNDFRRAYETARASKPAERAPAGEGLDVALTLEHGGGSAMLAVDLSNQGILPVHVRISNRTSRAYSFKVKQVLLQTTTNQKVKPLAPEEVVKGLSEEQARLVREKVLGDSEIAPQGIVDGLLFYPMQPYSKARVTLKDTADGEPEGFSINF